MSRNKKDFNYELANQRHNNKYDYSKVIYKGAKDKVEIVCPIHGSFWQTPDDHIRKGHGCPQCGKENRKKGKFKTDIKATITKDEFLHKSKELYGNKYQYPELENVFSYRRKIKIICPIHGEFYETPYQHLLNQKGCKQCLHDINYIDSITPVCIICSKHGEFWQKPNLHISSHCGCPKCNQSHGEEEISKYFKSKKIIIEEQKTINTPYTKSGYMFVDFYLKYNEKEYIIEFNGKQHYEYSPIFHINGIEDFYKQQLRDENLRKFCNENNIILIEISYKQLQNISIILDKYFI